MGSLLSRFKLTLQLSTITLVSIFVLATFTNNANAGAVPPNDDCPGSIQVFNGATPFDNFGATNSSPPPFSCSPGNATNDVWFNYTATCTGDVEFNTCASTMFSDTVMELYDTANCNDLVGNSIACDDDSTNCGVSGFNSAFVTPVIEGDEYLVRISGWNNSEGEGILDIIPQENCEMDTQDCVVTVVKSALPPDDTPFDFFTDADNNPDFTLSDPSDKTEGLLIPEGTSLTIAEGVPSGWQLNGVECEVTDPVLNVSSVENGVAIECVSGGQARCTFSNQIAARPIPTLSEWSMITVAVLLGAAGLLFAYRRRKAEA